MKNARLSTSELRRSATAYINVLIPYWASRSVRGGYGGPQGGIKMARDRDEGDGHESRHAVAADDGGLASRPARGDKALIPAMTATKPLLDRGAASPNGDEPRETPVTVLLVVDEHQLGPSPVLQRIAPRFGEWSVISDN